MTLRPRSHFTSAGLTWALVVALTTGMLAPLEAQAAQQVTAQNTQTVINGGIVSVNYDLNAPAAQTFAVALEVSRDGGATYALLPKAVTGDVGSGVAGGPGKRIQWDAAKDVDSLQFDNFRFRVSAKREQTTVPTLGGIRGATRNTNDSAPRTIETASTHGKNHFLLPGLGLMAGGVAVGVLAAAGPLRKESDKDGYNSCIYFVGLGYSDKDQCRAAYPLKANTALEAGGLAIAAGGLLGLLLGRHRASRLPTLIVTPGRLTASHTMRF